MRRFLYFFPGCFIPPDCFGGVTFPPGDKVVFPGRLVGAGEGVTGEEVNVYHYAFREKIIVWNSACLKSHNEEKVIWKMII